MIISASRNEGETTVDVIINPTNVMLQMLEDWKASIGVPHNSPIHGGYWMRGGNELRYGPFERIRLATREEIEQEKAIYNVLDLMTDLY
jgi:hypothetical protein